MIGEEVRAVIARINGGIKAWKAGTFPASDITGHLPVSRTLTHLSANVITSVIVLLLLSAAWSALAAMIGPFGQ